MAEPTGAGTEAAYQARNRVAELLHWARDELDLLSESFKPCREEELDALCTVQHVPRLPDAYDEFLRRMGHGGLGSAIHELFPGDDVSYESMMPDDDDWPGSRPLAEVVIHDQGYALDLGEAFLVIRLHRASEVDYVPVDAADPPVFGFTGGGIPPEQLFASFTDWLEFRIGRSIKRRYPLRSSHYRGR